MSLKRTMLRGLFVVGVIAVIVVTWMPRPPPLVYVPVPHDWSLLPPAVRQRAAEAAQACRDRPNDPGSFTDLGLIYHGNSEPALAIACYERALRLGAEDARTAYLIGVLYEDWGQTNEASDRLRLALSRDDGYAPAWFHLGRTLLDASQPDKAIEALRRAVEIEPNDPSFHTALGRALRQAGRLDDATASLRTAIRLDPDDAGAHQLLGLILRAQGDDAGADAHLGRVRQVSTQVVRDPWLLEARRHAATVDARLAWARGLIRARRLDSAIKLLGTLAAEYPDRAEVFRRLGEALARDGRLEPAAESYARAIEIEPFEVSTRNALAENLLLRNDLDGAQREVSRALELDPDDIDVRVTEAGLMTRQGRAAEALTRLQTLTAQRGDHVAGHLWLSEALIRLERYDEAAVALERLLELRPDMESARNRLALVYQKLGRQP